jgi:hypothetical protein
MGILNTRCTKRCSGGGGCPRGPVSALSNNIVIFIDNKKQTLHYNKGKVWTADVIKKRTVAVGNERIVSSIKCVEWRLTNSVALVRERTIPTERPPLVGEVGANFCG